MSNSFFSAGDLKDRPSRLAVVMTVLDRHRWSSMGPSMVQCECGAVVTGPANPNLTRFPADQAFREHMAREVLDALLLSEG